MHMRSTGMSYKAGLCSEGVGRLDGPNDQAGQHLIFSGLIDLAKAFLQAFHSGLLVEM